MANRMRIPDAAKALGVSEYFLRREARAGRIPAYRPEGRSCYLIDVDQVNKFLEAKALLNLTPDEPEEDEDEQYGKIRKVR